MTCTKYQLTKKLRVYSQFLSSNLGKVLIHEKKENLEKFALDCLTTGNVKQPNTRQRQNQMIPPLICFSTTLYLIIHFSVQGNLFVMTTSRPPNLWPVRTGSAKIILLQIFHQVLKQLLFFSPKGHYTLVLSLSGIVSDSVSMVRKFLSFLLKNRCMLVKPNTGSPQLTGFSNNKVFWIAGKFW